MHAISPALSVATLSLEPALRALATVAAYDLRKDGTGGAPDLPMLWHYQVVAVHEFDQRQRSHWPDGSDGHLFEPLVLEVANERLSRAYSDEADFIAPLPSASRAALSRLGAVPLLVRLQYLNECHALNGAAAMALVRHAQRRGVRWTVGGEAVAEIGWRWGACADGVSITILNHDPHTGEQRTKHQAHAHQLVTVTTVHGAVHILDLSVAQFGIDASLRCLPELVDRSAGCALSPTLAARAAAGIAPTLFAPQASADVARVMSTCLVQRGQAAVEAALALVDADGRPRHEGFLLCAHTMPSPLFGRPREQGEVRPDDDIIEAQLLENVRKFERALRVRCD